MRITESTLQSDWSCLKDPWSICLSVASRGGVGEMARRGKGSCEFSGNLAVQIASKIDKKPIPFSAFSLGGVFGGKGWPKGAKMAPFLVFFGICFWIW